MKGIRIRGRSYSFWVHVVELHRVHQIRAAQAVEKSKGRILEPRGHSRRCRRIEPRKSPLGSGRGYPSRGSRSRRKPSRNPLPCSPCITPTGRGDSRLNGRKTQRTVDPGVAPRVHRGPDGSSEGRGSGIPDQDRFVAQGNAIFCAAEVSVPHRIIPDHKPRVAPGNAMLRPYSATIRAYKSNTCKIPVKIGSEVSPYKSFEEKFRSSARSFPHRSLKKSFQSFDGNQVMVFQVRGIRWGLRWDSYP